ncbi:MAG: chromate transporter [Synergistaceae bacterium]|nr:chromate transporter [Synergistaceae bacterium]
MSVLGTLALVFARIGLGAFGGGLATIPFIHFELVASRAWLSERGFAEVVSLAQMTPGPLAVNAATYVGYRIAGVAGASVATFSVIAAPLLVLGLALFLISRASEKWKTRVDRLQRALRPAVSGMLFAAFWMVARSLTGDWRLWVMTAGVFMLIGQEYFKRYPQLLLLISGMAGVLFL